DILLPGALANIASRFRGNAVAAPIIVGREINGAIVRSSRNLSAVALLQEKAGFAQQGLWLPRERVQKVGLDITMNYIFDWQLALKYLSQYPRVDYISTPVAFFRIHDASKTVCGAR